jgi:hypothetical protein
VRALAAACAVGRSAAEDDRAEHEGDAGQSIARAGLGE